MSRDRGGTAMKQRMCGWKNVCSTLGLPVAFFSDEIVALKRLKMEKEKEGFPITSLREINTILKAQHPNIVTVRVRPPAHAPLPRGAPKCYTPVAVTLRRSLLSPSVWAPGFQVSWESRRWQGQPGTPGPWDLLSFPRKSSWAATWTRSTS